jgi:hypothetical protein
MIRDAIVEKVRAVRRKLLDECGGDMKRYMAMLKEAEAQDRDRLISRLPKEEETVP